MNKKINFKEYIVPKISHKDLTRPNKKVKLFEMFAGYGGASFALKKAGIDFECVGYSEV